MTGFFRQNLLAATFIVCAAVCPGSDAAAQAVSISKLAVMSFARGVPPLDRAEGRQLPDCRQTELVMEGQTIDPGAAVIVTRCLQQAFEKDLAGRVVPQNETAGAEELLAYMKTTATLKDHALKLGAHVQASHVVVGTVWRYSERKGTAYGADRPASVAFSAYMIDVAGGIVVAAATFDKTQQSLSENLLDAAAFFKHGAKWLTVEELTRRGAEDVVQKLRKFQDGVAAKIPAMRLGVGAQK